MRTHPSVPLGLAGLVLLTGCGGLPVDAAAVVDDRPISRAAFETRLGTVTANPDVEAAVAADTGTRSRLEAGVLSQLVDAAIAEQGATALGVEITDAALQDHIDRLVATELGGEPDAWQRFLDARGYPEAEVRAQLREDRRREAVEDRLLAEPAVTDEQVRTVHAERYAGRPLIAHVLVATEPEARQVLDRLAAGAEFAALAREFSLDSATAARGGDLGPHVEDAFAAPFEEAVENARDGQTVGPVQTAFGYHVIRRSAPAALDDVRGDIVDSLHEQAQDAAFGAWLADRRGRARIGVDPGIGRWDAAAGAVQP